jgi:hypothetical protein
MKLYEGTMCLWMYSLSSAFLLSFLRFKLVIVKTFLLLPYDLCRYDSGYCTVAEYCSMFRMGMIVSNALLQYIAALFMWA